MRYAKLGKDPTVRTDFLPDKDRQRQEEELREKLKVGYSELEPEFCCAVESKLEGV
jgi:hypothetical protein